MNSIGLGLSNSQPVLHFIDPRLTMLTERRNQYQIAAVNAKHSGNSQQALKYLRIKKVNNDAFHVVVLLVEKTKSV